MALVRSPGSARNSAKPSKNSQYSMAMGRLRALNAEVADHERIPRMRELHLVRR